MYTMNPVDLPPQRAAVLAFLRRELAAGRAPSLADIAVAFGFGVWLIVGSLTEFASRLRLGRAPWSETMRRLRASSPSKDLRIAAFLDHLEQALAGELPSSS